MLSGQFHTKHMVTREERASGPSLILISLVILAENTRSAKVALRKW